ncbi:unnamed protein product [Arabis nemorensis]|uniref:Protein E6-like n=1 Tax=Arabis nemorensis TaxID=586526 RepID=A0A565AKF5_9BRAS|nr:unnamed protein product [Arabis nemorensis]
MASFALKFIFCFLVAIFCFIDNNVEGREGKLFFSKFTHIDRSNKEVPLAPAPATSPGQAQANGRLGDGPFGPGSGMVPQTKESWPVSSTTTDEEFEKLMATFDEVKDNQLPEAFEEEEDSEDSEDLNEQKDKYNNNNNNGYTYTTNNNDHRRVYGNEEKKQGMSDTRFMENGKYFYDTRGKNTEYTPSRRYETARGNDHPNEFETMDAYYKSLEGSQEEYEP